MSHETFLRMALALLFAALYVNHHIVHRSPGFSRLARRSRSGRREIMFAFAMTLWAVLLGVWCLEYFLGYSWFEHPALLPLWVRWVGVVGMAACMPLSLWTHRSSPPNGPYRYVRHPAYAGLLLCAVSTCFITADYGVMLTVAVVAVTLLNKVRKKEVAF